MVHVHCLDGCAPTPLAHYLKALGILRLVAEQADKDARGWWDGEHFRLATVLTSKEIEEFFLRDYRPTPFVSPWNKGAGFFRTNDPGLRPLEQSAADRFSAFRAGIAASRTQIDALIGADREIREIKEESKARKKTDAGTRRQRTGFEQDYEQIATTIERVRNELQAIGECNPADRTRAKKKLEDAERMVDGAKKHRRLLDERDSYERGEDSRIKDVLGRIKESENYKRRLNAAERRFKQAKANLIPGLRLNWRGPHREWMDAAMVVGDDGTPKYPALLGTGGNDGRLDFTNNFMKRINEVFDLDSEDGRPRAAAPNWICAALWGTSVQGNPSGQAIGQYLPGTAGGANNANGPDSDSLLNPMDFILLFEGTLVCTSNAARRFASSEASRAASPFVVNASGAAYASASTADENARGEQWMPLWSRPSSYAELRRLFAEGRAQVGAKAVREPLDLARAVQRLGVSRGIKSFQRFGYIERNGQSNLAVPLGHFDVSERPVGNLACVDDLDSWLRRLRRVARDRGAPAHLAMAERRLTDALFAVTERSQTPFLWQEVLCRLTEVQEVMARGSGFAAQPVPRLRPEWVSASYDGSPEFRLALAFAMQGGGFHRNAGSPVDPIRRHWLPLDRDRQWHFATTGSETGASLDRQPDVVIHGHRAVDDAIALVERRLVEASQRAHRHLPLRAHVRASARVSDLAGLLSGTVDLDQTSKLARALMSLDHKAWAKRVVSIEPPYQSSWPEEAWLAIRLCMLPWPLRTRSGFELDIGADPALVRRLAGGDAATAFIMASRRLAAAGVRCTVRASSTSPGTARLWAAALAFPISKRTAERFLYRIDPNKERP